MAPKAKISTSDRDLIVVYTAKKEKPFGYDGLIKSHDGLSLARRFTEPGSQQIVAYQDQNNKDALLAVYFSPKDASDSASTSARFEFSSHHSPSEADITYASDARADLFTPLEQLTQEKLPLLERVLTTGARYAATGEKLRLAANDASMTEKEAELDDISSLTQKIGTLCYFTSTTDGPTATLEETHNLDHIEVRAGPSHVHLSKQSSTVKRS